MSKVYAVAIINAQGNIDSMYHPGSFPPNEGAWAQDKGKNVVHITEEVNIPNFIASRYWKEGWKIREAKTDPWWVWKDEKWTLDSAVLMEKIRYERDLRLFDSDIFVLPDFPHAADKLAEWKTYRQALRDVPANNSSVTDLNQVKWPTKPT
tara:strand:- start:27 stop:479 length:453 start_codon:yes stop_codon:yes gene_type:complete